ncbi:MAG: Bax inhibitor-1 family protein [Oscillospiraceae bacterium]
MVLGEGEVEISARKFNVAIGAVLLWGFILNFLIVQLFTQQLVDLVAKTSIWWVLGGYIVCVIIGWLLVRSRKALVSFIGYHFVAVPVGIVLAVSLQQVDTNMILQAIFMTALVTLAMFIMALLFPTFFLKMGRVIFFAVLLCIVCEVAAILIFHHDPAIFDWIAALLLSLYIGYDWARANKCKKTLNNAVDIATALYLDIINLFVRIIEIMQKSSD